MPFDDNDDSVKKDFNKKSSLKINNNNSLFSKKENISQSSFEEKINQSENKSSQYAERASQLSSSFRKILDDKTLAKNKNTFQLDVERQNLESLINLSIEMNEDENEKEAIGSTGLIALLLKSLLIQRDRINYLEYNLSKIESIVAKNQQETIDQEKK